ncbi:carboxymuconolactone decarboxylase family protein [Paenibacillus polymyxa]|uniref:carboxymuconolactone decarboxylase family protein n=1 Tax=Paenibacillus TaxID=44249 RepID=UPI0020B7CDA1|nr:MULTISPECIES: carboxymuconolactone decarboxylase family protein [Paenibacillus]MCP3805772.1 carboxymuconolactone decarboxylase family protein [Paenibacillus sp. Lou8.1]MDY7990730.1 carboxymuconolactone decarboxylase family protein [Paenibacillus polymyxa]MDY8117458.1 carboxymuconolactone decarboxylase family protein [Paenibacillus polymyxa]
MKHKLIRSSIRETIGDFAPAFVGYTEDVLFGNVWRRSELSLRERSLITVAALVACEHVNQLPYHLKLAKENGISEEELVEVITQLAFYVGWPRAASAIQVAKEVFCRGKES